MLNQCQDPMTFLIRSRVEREYELNDDAHKIGHADNVFNLLCYINFNQLLGIPEVELALMAYVHDIFARYRKHHEILASQVLPEICEELGIELSKDTMQRITMAIIEHRASFKGTYFSVYSEALSAADRGRPTSVKQLILRSYKYTRSKFNYDRKTTIEMVFKHMKEKFGREGYARYSPLYDEVFGEALEAQVAEVEFLTIEDTRAVILDFIGQEETNRKAPQTCWSTHYVTCVPHHSKVTTQQQFGNAFGTTHPSQDADHDGDTQTEWTSKATGRYLDEGLSSALGKEQQDCSNGTFEA